MKFLGLIGLILAPSAFAAGGFNFFAEASHATHIPAHTLALVIGSLVMILMAWLTVLKSQTLKIM